MDSEEEQAVVTDRDRQVVEWIGRLGAASAPDVMAAFGVGRSVAYRRIGSLVDWELDRRRDARPAGARRV